MRRFVGFTLMASLLLASSAPAALAADDSAIIRGFILDPSNQPAEGFRVVVMDTSTGKEYVSGPSNVVGEYALKVPVGARYQLVYAVAPDGTEIPVEKVAPLVAREAETLNLNVVFRATSGFEPPSVDKPWWKRPLGVVGIVLGTVVTGAAIGGGGSDGSPATASPSSP